MKNSKIQKIKVAKMRMLEMVCGQTRDIGLEMKIFRTR